MAGPRKIVLCSCEGTVALDTEAVRRAGKNDIARRRLVPALAVPSWLDPQTGAPRA